MQIHKSHFLNLQDVQYKRRINKEEQKVQQILFLSVLGTLVKWSNPSSANFNN